MKLHNIKTYDALLSTWRFNLKQVLPSSRKIIYWADQEHNTTYSPNDIFQFKGNSSDIKSCTHLLMQLWAKLQTNSFCRQSTLQISTQALEIFGLTLPISTTIHGEPSMKSMENFSLHLILAES